GDLAVLGHRLLADHDQVTVGDARAAHRVPGDLQHEQRALADQSAGQPEGVLDHLLGEQGTPAAIRPTSGTFTPSAGQRLAAGLPASTAVRGRPAPRVRYPAS